MGAAISGMPINAGLPSSMRWDMYFFLVVGPIGGGGMADHALGANGDVDISRRFGIFMFHQFLLRCSEHGVANKIFVAGSRLARREMIGFYFEECFYWCWRGSHFGGDGWALGDNSKEFLDFADISYFLRS